MNETLMLVMAWLTGVLLGTFFFGGLWWTVRKGVLSKRPASLFLVSMLLRTSVVIAGFYVVSDAHWQRLLACLVGFAIARFFVTRLGGPPLELHNFPEKKAGHAP